MNKTDLNNYIVNISNTSYKFTKASVFRIDRAIEHIKKNKKVYQYTIAYMAICLMPQFVEFGKYLIYEFMTALASQPPDLVKEWVFDLIQQCAKYFCMFAAMYNIAKINTIDTFKQLKRKYQ